MKILQKLSTILLILLPAIFLMLAVRGLAGNPTPENLLEEKWREAGPFELSPERGRFALLYSLVEDGSYYFSLPIARFVVPDLGYKDGHYVSLFAPTVSYLVMPGYILGKLVGYSQLGTFLTVSFVGLINLILIRRIVKKLTGNSLAGWLAGFTFLFATPAFTYAVNIYQHHFSTLLILIAINLLSSSPTLPRSFFFWFIVALSLSVDNPNLFMMAPLVIYHLIQLLNLTVDANQIILKPSLLKILGVIGVALPLYFFGWFNYQSYGNPLQLAGTIRSVKALDANGLPANPEDIKNTADPSKAIETVVKTKTATGFFKTRQILNGLYIHTISPDRGVVRYTPVILLGLIGFFFLRGRSDHFGPLLASIIGANILLYSMWGDPWGGWAFGSRYLIPSFAILAITLGVALAKMNRNLLLPLLFLPLLYQSIWVNSMGAITTSRIPPKAEVLELEKITGVQEKFSYNRTQDYLENSQLKSFAYNTYFRNNLTGLQYHQILTMLIYTSCIGLLVANALVKSKS